MKNLIDMLKFFFSNNPVKNFNVEYQLMLYFSRNNKFLKKYFQRRIYYKYYCEISHTALIDKSVQFVHTIAVVIGLQVVIEKKSIIYQCVTIGTSFYCDNKMPYIGANTIISTGAKLIEDISIGKNYIIGANKIHERKDV